MATLSNQQIKQLFAKARQAQDRGRLHEAEKGYTQLVKAAPQLAEVRFNLAEVFVRLGKAAEAAAQFEAALKLRPNEPAIWTSYLNMARQHPNPKNFDVLLDRAKPVLGKTPTFAYFKGLAALRDSRWDDAADLFNSAISNGFRQARVYAEYGNALAELKNYTDALAQFDKALSLTPLNDMILFRKSSLLQTMGRIEEARATVQKAIEIAPNSGRHYTLYASQTKMTADDANIPKMKTALKSKRLGDEELPMLAFSLAKGMEDSGQFGEVFTYLDQANHAVARVFPYDAAAVKQRIEDVQDLYEQIKECRGPVSDAAPIFVTGAPRSGTTLVEQILASHSSVEGGGELGLIQPQISDLLVSPKGGGKLDGNALLAECVEAAKEFQSQLQNLFPDATHVTDKSISSFSLIGFLAKAMPNARFVVVRRDPRDNALSLYKNQFRAGLHRYSNKLEDIAVFLRQFEEMVEFWRGQCPDAFHEIRYEELIAEPEAQSRALVDAVGLEWEDACLSFYETKREVRTLSATQVRQPMYSSSVGAWKKFEANMQPFLKAYGPIEE
ncbi:tetratricopeptide repeat-containing sulfotransferase family protein [uncultured Litoreibacter sp.]|uniref:tetratricopeptide repeat-containing sulfotransferase family protein n=1 Tax=uncultured Litoreibacter sp. TaxID=1392394 RepID=UPI00261C43EF|nr:tetratricopeptide repeat-containing sulfotransferase family protein [uncultured Litoreibacter sp.]